MNLLSIWSKRLDLVLHLESYSLRRDSWSSQEVACVAFVDMSFQSRSHGSAIRLVAQVLLIIYSISNDTPAVFM